MYFIILAAGLSKRMRPYTNDRPKSLLPIIGEKSFLEYQIEVINYFCEKPKIFVISGFKTDKVEKKISKLSYGNIKVLFNPEYDTKNNCYSLFIGLRYIREIGLHVDNGVLLNSDVVFNKRILKKLIEDGERKNKHTLMIDNTKKLGEEEMKILLRGNKIIKISKNINPNDAFGEYIGLTYISSKDFDLMLKAMEVISRESPNKYYEDGFQVMIDEYNYEFGISLTNGLFWNEIDTIKDYKNTRDILKDTSILE